MATDNLPDPPDVPDDTQQEPIAQEPGAAHEAFSAPTPPLSPAKRRKALWKKIRKEYENGDSSCSQLAKQYKLKPSAVSQHCYREEWKVKSEKKPKGITRKDVIDVKENVKAKVEKVLTDKMLAICDFTEREYYEALQNMARFDVAMLYEVTKEGVTTLRKDWLDIAKKHGALEQIQADCMTLDSGMVVQRLKVKPYSKLDVVEKLGKLMGFDKSDGNKAGVNIIVQWPEKFMIHDGKSPSNVESLSNTTKTIDLQPDFVERTPETMSNDVKSEVKTVELTVEEPSFDIPKTREIPVTLEEKGKYAR